jgi:hypothetical protein
MAKALKDAEISYDHIEADHELGGNWFHGVYKTVYTDTCKDVMQYADFPMPDKFPDFLSQANMLEYLNQYSSAFKLKEQIRFGVKVIWIQAIEANLWKVYFDKGNPEIYKGVIICNGHHWDKKYPDLPGQFTGEYVHAKEYKDPGQLKNKKVLIIGSGNSAADIACEAARVADLSVMNFTDSPWIFPKSFMGIPLGRIKVKNCPGFLNRILIKLLLRISFGKHCYYKLDTPKHKPLDKHPTVSEELPYYLKHGRITVKKGIKEISNKTVGFVDDSFCEFDLVVAATGYKLSFPFLPKSLTRTEGKNLRCIGHSVYPDYKGLFFMGWQQVRGGVGSLASAFSNVIVDLIRIEEESGLPVGMILQEMNNKISSTNLYASKEIFSWIRKHNYNSMAKMGSRIKSKYTHNNIPTSEMIPGNSKEITVF